MARNQLFESASTHGLALLGDVVEASKWLNYARGHLGGLLARQVGPTSLFLKPTAEIEIQIYTRPNKIVINAGGSPLYIHGYLSYVAHSQFVVYDGKNPTKYTSPIALTDKLTVAKSVKMPDTSDRPTFPRYRALSNGDYVCFGGYADPYNRVYKSDPVPGEKGGYIMIGNEVIHVGGSAIMDVGVIGGKLCALYYFTSIGGVKNLVMSYVDKNTKTATDALKIQISRTSGVDNRRGFIITADKYYIPGVQNAQSLTLLAKDAATIGIPTGADSKASSGNAVVEIVDARFSLDNSRLCVLAGLISDDWGMTSEIGPISTTNPGGGTKEFNSLVDLVMLPTNIWSAGALEMTEPFTGVVDANPIGYRFYKHEGVSRKEKFDTVLTTHSTQADAHFSGAYSHEYFACGGAEKLIQGGGAFFNIYVNHAGLTASTEGGLPSVFVEYIMPVGTPTWAINFTWTNVAAITWDTSDDLTEHDKYYSVHGIARRDFTVVVDYSYFGRSDLGVQTYTGYAAYDSYRSTRFNTALRVSGKRTITFSGTWRIGYSFDTDKKSVTYGARRFVEFGYKAEPLSDINKFSTIEISAEIDNAEIIYTEAAGVQIAPTTFNIPNSVTSSYTLTVTKGGAFAASLYIGDTVVSRARDIEGIPTGYAYSRTSHSDFEYSTSILTFQNVPKALDVLATCPRTGTLLPLGPNSDYGLQNLPVTTLFAGGVDFDTGPGLYYGYRYGDTAGNFPIEQVEPTNKASSFPTYTTLNIPGVCRMANTTHGIVLDGKDLLFNTIYEFGSKLPATSVSTTTINNKYFSTTAATSRGDGVTTPQMFYMPYSATSYVGVLEKADHTIENIGVDSYTVYTKVRMSHGLTSHAYKIPLKDTAGNDASQIAAIYTSDDIAASTDVSGDFPTKHSQFSRGGVAVLNTTGTKLADTRVFPDGSNPSVPENSYTRKVIGGYTIIK